VALAREVTAFFTGAGLQLVPPGLTRCHPVAPGTGPSHNTDPGTLVYAGLGQKTLGTA